MRRRPRWGLGLVVVLLVPLLAPALAAGAGGLSEEGQFGLAQALLAEGDFFRAVTELKRFLFLFPESPRADEARLAMADAYLAAGRADEAAAAFAGFREARPEGPLAERAAFGLALALLSQGSREAGRDLLRRLAQEPQGPYRSRAALELALSLAEEGQWAQAQEELRTLSPPGPQLERRLSVLAETGAQSKSPALAGLLSALLPGAGQAYCGRWRDGALALLVNGLFIWGAVEAGLRENWELAAGLSLVELAWYGGTIYGAINCAYRHERAQAERARRLLEREPEASVPLMLCWGCRF